MEFDSVVEKRMSARSFRGKSVDWRDILQAIDSACQGPFADGRNNLSFLIVEEPETIDKIAGFCEQTWINEASALIILCSDDKNLENMHAERGRVYARQQAGAAVMTILLKLTDIGISSCWVGSYKDELIKRNLGIPSNIQIEAIIPIGYETKKGKKKTKKALENSIFWEEWDNRKRPTMTSEVEDD